ncbi:TetR/AcrR family transcriptional regulator [Bradyrhizobium sp.]|uniref:TetR/AcrR family transcriptional regulator n=1 Tax=Bradyrhizobium sp. TaxID=376 RepID=UPI003C5E7AC2
MTASAAARKVPRGERRRMELVDVAEQLFLERGFSDTTMRMIAERAGASKETLYRHFASKELLFAEIVSRKAMQISGPDAALARGGKPEVVLTELGLGLVRTILSGQASCLFRTVVSEAVRTPELGDLFYQRGPGLMAERLASYLELASKRGELRCEHPLGAARLFLGAIASHYHVRSLVQSNWSAPTEQEITGHVDAAVAMFLARYQP